jgi:hypothetical protein
MIYYFTNEDDHSSTKIIQWINYLGGNVKRINHNKNGFLNSFQVNKSEINIDLNQLDSIDLDRDIIFYRRGMVGINYSIFNFDSIKPPHKEYIADHLKQEANDLRGFVNYYLDQFSMNSPQNFKVNKLIVLQKAKDVGISIPPTIITKSKSNLLKFCEYGEVICKPISDNILVDGKNFKSGSTTLILSRNDILMKIPDSFGYSLFQKLIKTKYEIRVFVFEEIVKAIATVNKIEGSEKELTKSIENSFRKIKRIVPYKISKELKRKIMLLMKQIDLKTGSIDFLMSENEELFFLEVNPVGQFDYVSYFGNYYLEKLIAEKLISKDEVKSK